MTTIHKMAGDLGAVCEADSYELAASWSNVTCQACRDALAASKGSTVQTLFALLDEAEVPATWMNTGGGCMCIEVNANGRNDLDGFLLVSDTEGSFSTFHLENDDDLSGFFVGQYDENGDMTDEAGIYTSDTSKPLGHDLAEVVQVVRNYWIASEGKR